MATDTMTTVATPATAPPPGLKVAQTPILEVERLSARFTTPEGPVAAVNDVSLSIAQGETVGIVGESGSGKTQLFLSVLGLLASNGTATGSVRFHGEEILNLPPEKLNTIRGGRIAMIFQDSMTALNPFLTVRRQLTEVLVRHKHMSEGDALRRAIEILDLVKIPQAASRIGLYPHEFSGGMRQRVMIAMALLCQPDLLIADEPTTALDVTVQAAILDLMSDLKREFSTSIVMITHDLGVIAGLSDRVLVMYGGRIVEKAPVEDLFYDPQHPYTAGLLSAMPRLDLGSDKPLNTIPGQPPNLQHLPHDRCPYAERCSHVFERCHEERPHLRTVGQARSKACHLESLT